VKTPEINFVKRKSGDLSSNEDEIKQIMQEAEIHSLMIDSIVVCPNSDGLAIQGLQFTLKDEEGGAMSAAD